MLIGEGESRARLPPAPGGHSALAVDLKRQSKSLAVPEALIPFNETRVNRSPAAAHRLGDETRPLVNLLTQLLLLRQLSAELRTGR